MKILEINDVSSVLASHREQGDEEDEVTEQAIEQRSGSVAVRRVEPEDVERLADVLARAFHDDPMGVWFQPDEQRRPNTLRRLFHDELQHVTLPHGECLTNEDLSAVALWAPPGHWKVPNRIIVRQLPNMVRAFGRRLPLVLRGWVLQVEKQHPTEPHYYLPAIGVVPEIQNRGLGSALLRPVLDRCDHEQLGAYLEASSEANRRLYLRYGFEVTGEIVLPKGPTIWPMWRKPRVAGNQAAAQPGAPVVLPTSRPGGVA